MKVVLLECTPNAEALVAAAANQCYNPGFVGDTYKGGPLTAGAMARIHGCIESGHHSVLEHASYAFGIQGISRACSHQLVRARLASYSQQSQRYCASDRYFDKVCPPSIHAKGLADEIFDLAMNYAGMAYEKLLELGIPAEDARFVLPNAAETNIIVTMNARELRHFFSLRCCVHAQWEIRDMTNRMKDLCKAKHPVIFHKVGAHCDVDGTCPEGSRSCGRLGKEF
jgi:thymidylate synthase (FAD)